MSKKKKIGIILIIVVLIVAMLIGYTFSKYKQSISIESRSAVAKWSFTGKIENEKNSSILSTISLADTVESDSVLEKRIAPGTSGEFKIIVDATESEVDIDYLVSLENETNKPQNLFFTYDGQKFSTLSNLIRSVNDFSGQISHTSENKTKTYTIGWEWPYETTKDGVLQDEIDLQDGQNIKDYIFTLKITGTQSV